MTAQPTRATEIPTLTVEEWRQETIDRAINEYLQVAQQTASRVRSGSQRAMLAGYLDLLRGEEPAAGSPA